ncbi:tetratricopeptide repeat protein [Actinokineospora auranticolor]|uniref:Tetratricopeptide repeat protein n=1 Tax=Actinokineospora auranticolor TaxID=155976 RepID=A0A2S6GBK7_9PSEU|nr:tetratricopeptide repeat protein [Actinokineospora auranticolor]PPK60917.1 tetratricopeptide repeat protein [Actinokineospora auranticolor]
MFALLGIAPGSDTGTAAVARLTGLPEREARAALRALTEVSLVNRVPGNRHGMHDLIRAYAMTIADDLPADIRDAAVRRVVDFYTHTAHAAALRLDPHHDLPRPDPPVPGADPQPVPDAAAAWAWFDAECTCLLAAQHTAATRTWYPAVWHLAWGLYTYQYRRGHRHDRLVTWQLATDAAAHLPDPAAPPRAHRFLGLAHAELGDHDGAIAHLHQALALAEQLGDATQQARTQRALARAWGQRGDDQRALEHAVHALGRYRSLGQPGWVADALNAVGWCEDRLGHYDAGGEHCRAALTLYQRHDNPDGEAAAHDSLGWIEHHRGHHHEAVDHYRRALAMFRDLGNSHEVADSLDGLGHPYAALGRHEQSRTVWLQALALYREQGRGDDADRVLRQLDELPPQSPTAE